MKSTDTTCSLNQMTGWYTSFSNEVNVKMVTVYVGIANRESSKIFF